MTSSIPLLNPSPATATTVAYPFTTNDVNDVNGVNVDNVNISGGGRRTCVYREAYKHILLPVVYSVVFALALALNGSVLYLCAFRTERRRWSANLVYLANLAAADLLYACSLPLLVLNYARRDRWPFGDAACRAVRFAFYANLYGSVAFLAAVSLNRYLGVCHPLRFGGLRGRRAAARVSAAAWLAVAAETAPTAAFARSGVLSGRAVCYDLTSPENFAAYFPYGVALTAVGFAAPFAVVAACYVAIVRALLRRRRSRVGQVRHGGGTGAGGGGEVKRAGGRSFRLIAVVCLSFAVCFLPFHVTRMVYLFVKMYGGGGGGNGGNDGGGSNYTAAAVGGGNYTIGGVGDEPSCELVQTVSTIYKATRPLASLNCCINPVLYFLSGDYYRRGGAARWRCCGGGGGGGGTVVPASTAGASRDSEPSNTDAVVAAVVAVEGR
ncbi:P2Y purinoceptor 6-like [Petromyzon marinus]|uniref:P2Y purinoceptor 6-like n=1 Tax=Petromyzon marinus TaxID=7757 RepID=UPI003F6F0641